MKRLLVLVILSLLFFSCTKEKQNEQNRTNVKSNKITCDKFILNANLNDGNLSLAIDSDLPEFTDIIVRISRSYWEQGNEDEYSIDYFKEKSSIKHWIQKRSIIIMNSDWNDKLISHQKKMFEYGPDFQFKVDAVSNDIKISVIVPIKQSNPLFWEKNVNLSGKEVTHTSINFIDKCVFFEHPISGYTIKSKPEISKSNHTELNGKCIDNTGAMKGIIHDYFKNGIIRVDTHCSDGSVCKQTATIKTINKTKRYYVSDSVENEYFIFGTSNEMKWYDNYGYLKYTKSKQIKGVFHVLRFRRIRDLS